MPELPEVRTVVDYLNSHLKGKTIREFQLFYNPLFVNLKTSTNISDDMEFWKKAMHNQKIEEVFAYGKYILFRLQDWTMISHLRMEGKWILEQPDLFSYNENLVEAQFTLDGQSDVLRYYDFRRFGTLEIVKKDQWLATPAIAKLGYEPFDKRATGQWLFSKLQRSRKPIKTVLLDQTIILGLGNIYVNEVLFATKIHPERTAKAVTFEEAEQLLASSVQILTEAIAMGGTTIHSFTSGNKVPGSYQEKLKVHGREHKPCLVCGTKIQKIFVGGRGTYFCPVCQSH